VLPLQVRPYSLPRLVAVMLFVLREQDFVVLSVDFVRLNQVVSHLVAQWKEVVSVSPDFLFLYPLRWRK
jgi:hypothetical protein